jgi:hypothetical protein
MQCCTGLADARLPCCAGCRDALRMQAAAAYSHRADKVSISVPLPPTSVEAAPEGPLSPTVVLVLCCRRLRPAASAA